MWVINKTLMTLEEADKQASSRAASIERVPAANGIACPACGAELNDSNNGMILMSHPMRVDIECPSCPYRGTRVY